MADGDHQRAANVVPRQRYYLVIDGTGSEDSVEYGKLLEEGFGWRNLATEFLEPVSGEDRLLDPNHPYLPICTFEVGGRKKKPIAVVCPGGRHGRGLDKFWESYIGETPEEQANQGRMEYNGNPIFGRYSAAYKSSLFMNELIVVPAVEFVDDAAGRRVAQLKHGELFGSPDYTEPDVHAELLIVSSHGWLGGYMRGDNLAPSRKSQPESTRDGFYPPSMYFLVGRTLAEGGRFLGPKWVILPQCSTVNSATWLTWAKVLARSLPAVRGILGYEEVSPGVHGSISIARDLFDRLRRGQSMLKAWRSANAKQKWAAIVHKEALNDRMTEWDVLPKLTEVTIEPDKTSYLAFGASLERGKEKLVEGKEILDVQPPFGLVLERRVTKPGEPVQSYEITEDKLDMRRAWLEGDAQIRTTITAPGNATITSFALRWIHMRPSHSVQPSLKELFQSFTAVPDGAVALRPSPHDRRTLQGIPSTPAKTVVIDWVLQPDKVLERTAMEHHHSFVWPLVKVDLAGAANPTEAHPFSTRGLLF